MNEKPNYYAIIPADVRYDKNLKANEKLLYAEIVALSNKDGYCYATNKYFANLYEVSIQSISSWLNNLIENGYIESEIIYKENTKEIAYRKITTLLKKSLIPIKENFKGGIKENFKDNNINNIILNNNNNIYIGQVVDYLNQKIGTHYKSTTPKTKSLINARLKEGFTVDDFKTVIDNKYNDWFKDKKMCQYLRPETLFGTKFENYLNQKTKRRLSDEELIKMLEEEE